MNGPFNVKFIVNSYTLNSLLPHPSWPILPHHLKPRGGMGQDSAIYHHVCTSFKCMSPESMKLWFWIAINLFWGLLQYFVLTCWDKVLLCLLGFDAVVLVIKITLTDDVIDLHEHDTVTLTSAQIWTPDPDLSALTSKTFILSLSRNK